MQTILLYIGFLNIVLTGLTVLFVWGIARFPETPSRPYWLLAGAFILRLYSQVTGIGFIDEIFKSEVPTFQLAVSTIVGVVVSAFFLYAFIETYVLLKKKYP